MSTKYNWSLIVGGTFVLFGIVLGAFGAHSLKKMLEASQLQVFETGVKYQIYSGFGLILFFLVSKFESIDLRLSFFFLAFGTILFSTSLYILACKNLINLSENSAQIIGPITPLGGFFQIVSWLIFITKSIRKKTKDNLPQ